MLLATTDSHDATAHGDHDVLDQELSYQDPAARAQCGAHRHFAVTGAQGEYHIEGVPPGTYTVTVWHPTFTAKSESVKIPEQGGEVEVGFVLS